MGQATKSPWWMPWGQGPMKGAARLRKASVSRLAGITEGARMGKPVSVLNRDIPPLVRGEGKWGN